MKNTPELIQQAQQENEKAMEELIQNNSKLIYALIHKRKYKPELIEDLYQVGVIGLIKAVRNFDTTRNLQLSTYAVPMILGEIKRYLRDQTHSLHVSRSLKLNYEKIVKYNEIFTQKNQREPTLSEIEQELRLTKEDILFAMEANATVNSLSEVRQDNGDKEILLEEKISDQNNNIEKWIEKDEIWSAFNQLNETEKKVIKLRFFQEKTQQEIGKKLGVSQAQISRVEKRALQSLKEAINPEKNKKLANIL